ncbi:LysM peptidoglycan-binding domain-containing protein [Streptomyces sp. NPDC050844]|uniref:LysM peptidoglycan-binding domain-containing protein n=1 Tax=Streptomyces sp. NPDC050844 TaxID=3155790 RepID=UPI0033D986BB
MVAGRHRDVHRPQGRHIRSIAAAKLGDRNRWDEIADLNDLKDADEIVIGQKLKLPKK